MSLRPKRGPNGNRWLYPDVVGLEDLGTYWHQEVRECFFQAVSNSSWANFGYLVAEQINGQETLQELRMLFAAHGIGVIRLDAGNLCRCRVLGGQTWAAMNWRNTRI